MTTVPTIDMEIFCCAAWTTLILVQVDFLVSNCLPYDCMLHIFWQLVYDFTWFDFYKRFHSFLKEFHQTLKDFILSSSRLSDLPYFTRLAAYLPLSEVFAEFIWYDSSFCHAITLWATSLLGRESLFFIPFAVLQPAQALPNKTVRFAK